jgi:8-oxo-dGTP diphosphatase
VAVRRFGGAPKAGKVYRRRRGAYAALIGVGGGRVLLTRQADPGPEYQLPGGGIEPGEHPLAALHREVFEETGWLIAGARRLGVFRRFAYMPEYDLWAEKICIIYAARPVRRLGPPAEAGHSAHWLAAGDALRLLGNPGDAHFLARALGDRGARNADGAAPATGAAGRATPDPGVRTPESWPRTPGAIVRNGRRQK